jgi:hypothetical protein
MRRVRPPVLLVTLSAALGGCGGHHSPARASTDRDAALQPPVASRLSAIQLQETDSLYVGRPAALAVDPRDGSLYVSDAFWGRVLRFAPDGRLVRAYGRRGDGPGELRAPGAVEVVDSAVVVLDERRLTRFRRDGGEFLGSARYGGVLTSISPSGGRLWLGGLNVSRGTSLGTWNPGDAEVRHLGAIPAEFTRSEPMAGIYTGVEVVAWGDTVLAGYEGLNRITLFRTDGTAIRSLRVPVRRRKGEIPDVVDAMRRLDFPHQFGANSVLFRLARLPGGNLALVHYDQSIDGNLISARVFLTVARPDFSRVCADREITVSRDAQPYTAFRGDTLYVVQQKVTGEKSRAFVDRYVVDERSCPGSGSGTVASR